MIDSEPQELSVAEDAIEREAYKDEQLKQAQGEIQRLARTVQKLAKKTGIKETDDAQVADGEGWMATDFVGNLIVDWRMLPGSTVLYTPDGHVVDNQFVEITTKGGSKQKLAYAEFAQMIAGHKIPVRIMNYLKKNAYNQWIPYKVFKQDELVRVQLGRLDGQEKIYDGEEMDVKLAVINA